MVSNFNKIRDLIEKLKGSLEEWQKKYSDDLDQIDLNELVLNYDSVLYVKVPYGAEIPELFITGPIYRYQMSVRNILKYLDEGIDLEIHNKETHIENIYLLGILYNHALEQRKKDSKSREILSLQPLTTAIDKLRKMMNIVDLIDMSKVDPKERLINEVFDNQKIDNNIDDSYVSETHNQIVAIQYGGQENYNRAIAHLNTSKKNMITSVVGKDNMNKVLSPSKNSVFKTTFKKKSVENESLEKETNIPNTSNHNSDNDIELEM